MEKLSLRHDLASLPNLTHKQRQLLEKKIVADIERYLGKRGRAWVEQREAKSKDPSDLFRPLLIFQNREKGRTLHDSDDIGADTRVVLTLPEAGEKTPWEILSPEARQNLVRGLAQSFRIGNYNLRDHKDFKYDRNLGFSPLLSLGRATRGEMCGECRWAAANLAGLMGELGFPPESVRLVASSDHIWVEYQAEPNGKWIEIDPTPVSEARKMTDKEGDDVLALLLLGPPKNHGSKPGETYTIYPFLLYPHEKSAPHHQSFRVHEIDGKIRSIVLEKADFKDEVLVKGLRQFKDIDTLNFSISDENSLPHPGDWERLGILPQIKKLELFNFGGADRPLIEHFKVILERTPPLEDLYIMGNGSLEKWFPHFKGPKIQSIKKLSLGGDGIDVKRLEELLKNLTLDELAISDSKPQEGLLEVILGYPKPLKKLNFSLLNLEPKSILKLVSSPRLADIEHCTLPSDGMSEADFLTLVSTLENKADRKIKKITFAHPPAVVVGELEWKTDPDVQKAIRRLPGVQFEFKNQ